MTTADNCNGINYVVIQSILNCASIGYIPGTQRQAGIGIGEALFPIDAIL
jgi:hypothetical protein